MPRFGQPLRFHLEGDAGTGENIQNNHSPLALLNRERFAHTVPNIPAEWLRLPQAFEEALSRFRAEERLRLKNEIRYQFRRCIPAGMLEVEKAERTVFAPDHIVKTEIGWRKARAHSRSI